MLWVRLRIGDGRGVSASVDVIFGDGVGETRLNSLLLSNTAAAACSHVGMGGSCFVGDGHGVESSIGVGGVIRAVGDRCKSVGVSIVVGVAGDGIDDVGGWAVAGRGGVGTEVVGVGGFAGVDVVEVVAVAELPVSSSWLHMHRRASRVAAHTFLMR